MNEVNAIDYINNEIINNKNPLLIDGVRVLINEQNKSEEDVDKYLAYIYGFVGSEKLVEYMMEDYYYSDSKIDLDSISDDWWTVYCYQLNKYVKNAYTTKIMPAEVHYFRNKLNRAPISLEALFKINDEAKAWILLPVSDSVFHMYGNGGEFNVKFVSQDEDNVFEAVYDMTGMLLTYENDPHSCSTYNYCGPSDKFAHAVLDVIPYYLYYSIPDIQNPYEPVLVNLGVDITLLACKKESILALTDEIYELASVENRIKYYSNPEAQNYRRVHILKSLFTDCIYDIDEHAFSKGERLYEIFKK